MSSNTGATAPSEQPADGPLSLDDLFNAELAAMFTRDLSLCRRVPARRQLSFSQRLLEATARLFSQVL